jgi:chromosome segregation ATPase
MCQCHIIGPPKEQAMTEPTDEIAAWRKKAISHDCNYGRECFTDGHGDDYPMVDEAVTIMLRQRERIAELEAKLAAVRNEHEFAQENLRGERAERDRQRERIAALEREVAASHRISSLDALAMLEARYMGERLKDIIADRERLRDKYEDEERRDVATHYARARGEIIAHQMALGGLASLYKIKATEPTGIDAAMKRLDQEVARCFGVSQKPS